MDDRVKSMLQARLAEIEARLSVACESRKRRRQEITLLAVTKTVSDQVAGTLMELGVLELGESRPQELWKKAAALPSAHWHLIGHLQRNKIVRTLPLVRMVHSVDSTRLLQALEEEAGKQKRILSVLLEVNASHEVQKHGFAPEQLHDVAQQASALQFVQVRGFMTMAALDADAEQARPAFLELRRLRDQLRSSFAPPHNLEHLSMGMSNDFEVAIEEGATIVRLGTVLFHGLENAP